MEEKTLLSRTQTEGAEKTIIIYKNKKYEFDYAQEGE